jgi:uncharacterized protein
MTPSILFLAHDIPVEGVAIDVELTTEWLDKHLADAGVGAQEGDAKPGRVKGRLSRSGPDVVVRAHVTANLAAACVRCLDPAPLAVAAELSLLLTASTRSDARRGARAQRQRHMPEHEFGPAEADVDVYDGETVVLDAFVREAILLEVPNFPLCRASCPGIAVRDAVAMSIEPEPTVDPRLAPLDAFRQREGPATVDDLIAAASARREELSRKPMVASHRSGKSRPRGGGKR